MQKEPHRRRVKRMTPPAMAAVNPACPRYRLFGFDKRSSSNDFPCPSASCELRDSVESVTVSSKGARWGGGGVGSSDLSVAVFDRLASQMMKFIAETEKLKHHEYSGKLSQSSAPGDFISSPAVVLKEVNCLDKKSGEGMQLNSSMVWNDSLKC